MESTVIRELRRNLGKAKNTPPAMPKTQNTGIREFDKLLVNKGKQVSVKPEKATKSIEEWRDFYAELFGYKLEVSRIYVPAKVAGIERFIVEVPDISIQTAFDKAEGIFPCWKAMEESLDRTVYDLYPRRNTFGYWVRDHSEADEKFKGLSAEDMLVGKRISGVTMRGHILFHIKFFLETGKHPDRKTATITSGSRYLDGDVPYVSWVSDNDGMRVGRIGPRHCSEMFRVREAVSAP